ncbi:MAG TPA: phospholipase A2 [Micromonosporaceae bacterium]|nr:phospholipase A2 [Micromonosporaceae bacterium]
MTRRRFVTFLAATAGALLTVLGLSGPAYAVDPAQKLAVLSSWTQTSVDSYNAWNSARQNQGAWAAYAFDWSTDYCSSSPDNPLGFDFRLSCYRHDFGYRNYKAVGQFPANKTRLDDMFYADLKRRCAAYNVFVRPACYSLAWTYYQAVRAFGNTVITSEQLNEAAQLKAIGERQQLEMAR